MEPQNLHTQPEQIPSTERYGEQLNNKLRQLAEGTVRNTLLRTNAQIDQFSTSIFNPSYLGFKADYSYSPKTVFELQ